MKHPLLRVLFVVLTIICSIRDHRVVADDWTQWRGSKLDSLSTERKLPADLSDPQSLKWKTKLPGPAGSSPIVVGERIFLTTVEGNDDGAKMFLLCFGTDGKQQWKQQLDGQNQNSRDSANSASSSPMTDGEHVWTMMGNGILQCFTVAGEAVWKVDLQKKYGQFKIQFGMTTSPILDRGRIYLALIHGEMRDQKTTSIGHVIGLNAATGEEFWYHKRLTDGVSENTHSYASPTIYRNGMTAFLITHGADYVIGHSLEDGSELWRCGGINLKGPNYNPYLRFVASPTCVPGMIVVPSAKRGPVLALDPSDLSGDLTGRDDCLFWKLNTGTPDVATPLIYDGLVYLADEKGVLVCVDQETGKIVYQERLFASNHRSTPVGADGKVYITGRDGEVYVVQAGREFKLLSKIDLGEETTASPAISGGKIYVRTFESLVCFGS